MYYIGILYSMYMYIYIYKYIKYFVIYSHIYIYTYYHAIHIMCYRREWSTGRPWHRNGSRHRDPQLFGAAIHLQGRVEWVGGEIMGKSMKNDEHFKKNEVLN